MLRRRFFCPSKYECECECETERQVPMTSLYGFQLEMSRIYCDEHFKECLRSKEHESVCRMKGVQCDCGGTIR